MKLNVSIIIPTRNEEIYIKECLDAIFDQNTDLQFDVLVIDSSSTDQTTRIVKSFSSVKLVSIKPEEFGHGKTRNTGARMTAGEYIVFLNADAIPANKNWLTILIDSIKQDRSFAGVFSRHIPRKDCHLYMERDIRCSMPASRKVISRFNSRDSLLFSTVSCVMPRSIWQQYPFDDHILIAEDQNWAKNILDQGYRIVYQPESMVTHSHNYSLKELYQIKVRVGQSLKAFRHRPLNIVLGLFLVTGGMILKFISDIFYIISRKLPFKKRFKELGVALGSRIVSFAGRYVGWMKS